MKKHLKKVNKFDLITLVATLFMCTLFINISEFLVGYHNYTIFQEKHTYAQNINDMFGHDFDFIMLIITLIIAVIFILACCTITGTLYFLFNRTASILFIIATTIGVIYIATLSTFIVALHLSTFVFSVCAIILSSILLNQTTDQKEEKEANILKLQIVAIFCFAYLVLVMCISNYGFDVFQREIKAYNNETVALDAYKPKPIKLSTSESIKLDPFPNKKVPNNNYVPLKIENKSSIQLTDNKNTDTQKITLNSTVSSAILVYPNQQLVNATKSVAELTAYNVHVPTLKLDKVQPSLNLYQLKPNKDTTYNLSFKTTESQLKIDVVQSNNVRTLYSNEAELERKKDVITNKQITVKKNETAYINFIGTNPIETVVTEK